MCVKLLKISQICKDFWLAVFKNELILVILLWTFLQENFVSFKFKFFVLKCFFKTKIQAEFTL